MCKRQVACDLFSMNGLAMDPTWNHDRRNGLNLDKVEDFPDAAMLEPAKIEGLPPSDDASLAEFCLLLSGEASDSEACSRLNDEPLDVPTESAGEAKSNDTQSIYLQSKSDELSKYPSFLSCDQLPCMQNENYSSSHASTGKLSCDMAVARPLLPRPKHDDLHSSRVESSQQISAGKAKTEEYSLPQKLISRIDRANQFFLPLLPAVAQPLPASFQWNTQQLVDKVSLPTSSESAINFLQSQGALKFHDSAHLGTLLPIATFRSNDEAQKMEGSDAMKSLGQPIQFSAPGAPVKARRKYRHESFPQKLYRLLEETAEAGQSHIISFISSGQGFRVHDPHKFGSEIAPRYFRHNHYHSFQRQLSQYGFERIHSGPHIGGYKHPMFKRGDPCLCGEIRRVSEQTNGTCTRSKSDNTNA